MSSAHHFQPSIRKQSIKVHSRQRCGVLYVRLKIYSILYASSTLSILYGSNKLYGHCSISLIQWAIQI
ncbi:hypothetical protein [Rubritalea tangerina]|uniref:hypothetical protein n=1 Tax=Rubritalea tangerina TaxID=430798 RepID=UPI003617F08D